LTWVYKPTPNPWVWVWVRVRAKINYMFIIWNEMPKTLTWGLAPLKCHTVTSIIQKATLFHGLI
jgi:hypothetical protein